MSRASNVVALLAGLLIAQGASGITWEMREIRDPIKPGATCKVPEPMSHGSYIYHAPSKYDQVFWPITDPKAIWFCPEPGFAAFVGYVEDLTSAERAAIAARLARTYRRGSGGVTVGERLSLLQQAYALRNKGRSFRVSLLRALAFMYEEEGDQARAGRLRREALLEVRKALDGALEERERLEYLFLCAAYEREFGHRQESETCLGELEAALSHSEASELRGYVSHLSLLVADVRRIAPGGRLAPTSGGPRW